MPYLDELHGSTRAVVCVVRTDSVSRWSILGTIYDHAAAATGYAESWPHDPSSPAVLASAFGQVALAQHREHAETLMRARVPRMTPYTATHPIQLGRALDRAAANGEAIEHEGLFRGWSCLAVPVGTQASGPPPAVLAVIDTSRRFNTRRYLAQAHAAAEGIGRRWLETAEA
jgi:DNA-binding IclR family transcriptional regulator